MKLIKQIIFLSLIFNLVPTVWANNLVSKVDHNAVEMGDILTLLVTADFQTNLDPDFSILLKSFDILNRGKSSNLRIINGKITSETSWQLTLTPKNEGELVIPSLSINKISSKEIKIKVFPVGPNNVKNAFLKATIEPKQGYVQQEISYVLRLYYRGQLIDGNITAPNFTGTLNKIITNQKSYSQKINNSLYQVYEWVYNVYPQQSGKLNLGSARFIGRLQTINGILTRINLSTKPITIEVKPKPKDIKSFNWLPANNLTVSLAIKQQPPYQVGESIPIILKLTAVGLLPSQLPDIKLPTSSDYKVYDDKADVKKSTDNKHVISSKLYHYLLIPAKSGTITVPAISISWWDTSSNSLKKSQTKLKKLEIQPAITTASPPINPLQVTKPINHSKQKIMPKGEVANKNKLLWILLFISFMLNVVLISLWLWTRKKLMNYVQVKQIDNSNNPKISTNLQHELIDKICKKNITTEALKNRKYLLNLYKQLPIELLTPEQLNSHSILKRHLFYKEDINDTLIKAVNELCKLSSARTNNISSSIKQSNLTSLYPS